MEFELSKIDAAVKQLDWAIRLCAASPIWSGGERVIASTDCGLGGRVHPQIAWAKLEALVAGAALASRRLWG
jgi:methionine synthase II (cobalamin-independent)